MERRLRMAVVGVGFGAQVHVPAFLSIPGVEIVGLADSGSGRAGQVAAGLGRKVVAWGSWQKAVEAPDVDAVSVATPPWVQADVVCAALAAGKHVLCEKPFGANGEDAARMWESARKTDRVHAVDFEFRMEPGIAALQRLVKSGEIGELHRIDVAWLTGGRADSSLPWSWQHDAERGGGILNAYGSHVVDYVQWISGTHILRTFAQSRVLVRERPNAQGRAKRVTAEDSCDLLCVLANGAVANLKFSNCYPVTSFHRIEIYGGKGRLVYLHKFPFKPEQVQVCTETDRSELRPVSVASLAGEAGVDTRFLPFRELARRFIDAASRIAVRDLPDFSCGLRAQRVLDAARDSLRSGGEVLVSAVGP